MRKNRQNPSPARTKWGRALQGMLIISLLALTACETADRRAERRSPFNGKTLGEVIAVIGKPTKKTGTEAVWSFRETFIFYSKQYAVINNKLTLIGTTPHEGVRACIFRAKLKRGRVVASRYRGQGCARYAPKLSR